METNVQPSFIPRKTLSPQPIAKPQHSISFFNLIATIAFITVLVLSGVVFGAEYYIKTQLQKKSETLQTELNKFEPALIAELSRMDSRIQSSRELLNNHLAFSSFFDVLGGMTLKNIRYTSFSFTGDSSKINITMDGQAPSFSAVALQAAEFFKPVNQRYILGSNFSNLSIDQRGNVGFSLSASVNPQMLLYATSSQTIIEEVGSTTPATQ